MGTFKTFYHALLGNLVVALLVVLLLLMGTQIVLRYFFSSSLIWAEEVCRYLLVWVSFLAISIAYERGEIASVTMFRDTLSRKGALLLAIFANLAGVALLLTLIYYGVLYAQRLGRPPIPGLQFLISDLFGPGRAAPTMFWIYIALPVGLSLFALRLAIDVVHYARMIGTGESVEDLRARAEQGAVS